MSIAQLNRFSIIENHPMYGKSHSEESKNKISLANKGINSYWLGKHHSEESKNKISLNNKKFYSEHPDIKESIRKQKSKKVYQYDKDNNLINIFESVREAEKNTGIHRNCISNCCCGRQKYAGKYFWKYLK